MDFRFQRPKAGNFGRGRVTRPTGWFAVASHDKSDMLTIFDVTELLRANVQYLKLPVLNLCLRPFSSYHAYKTKLKNTVLVTVRSL